MVMIGRRAKRKGNQRQRMRSRRQPYPALPNEADGRFDIDAGPIV